MKLPIELLEPFRRIPGKEVRSKLIVPNCQLYQFLEQYRNNLIKYSGRTIAPNRMDYHIEILERYQKNDINTYLARVKFLNNTPINVADIDNFGFLGNAFVLFTPELQYYGKTHITIAYFKDKGDIYNAINCHPCKMGFRKIENNNNEENKNNEVIEK